ncbi:MAG: glutamyl-tRNA reductase [Candidatus Omnitrophica bacterium]|nr:glutamyl-tRNA reductase [Candidatus Omnitrophota bacterium]
MEIIVVGINHKTAPISIREKFYLNSIQQDLLLSELRSDPAVVEAFVVSTCNRIEIYVHVINEYEPKKIVMLICQIRELAYSSGLMGYFYIEHQRAAVEHLFKVVTGLDSLVLGEKQILGQVKSAFEKSAGKHFLGKNFNILWNVAIRTGKKARNETDISSGGSSISWAAVTKAEKYLGTLSDKSVLMIGAGEMSKLAVGQISDKGFRKLYLMNRTIEHAQCLADTFNGEVVSFCDIKEILSDVDLCICSSSAPHYILDKLIVEKVMELRKGKQLIFMDISMPRNIDPKIASINNVVLYHIDDLESVVQENLMKREAAVRDVEKIVAAKLDEYYSKIARLTTEHPTVTL